MSDKVSNGGAQVFQAINREARLSDKVTEAILATIVSLIQPLLALGLYAGIAALYAVTSQGATSPRPIPNPSPLANGERR